MKENKTQAQITAKEIAAGDSWIDNLSDEDFAYTLCAAMFDKALMEFTPGSLAVTEKFAKEKGIEKGSGLYMVFSGFEMGVSAAIDLFNKLPEKAGK